MIVPSIDLMNGRAVQLRRGTDFVLDGGDPLERLAEFSVVGEVAVIDLDAALGRGSNAEIIRRMVREAPCRVGGGIRDLEGARTWLDAGATKVIIGTCATPKLLSALPRDRVIAALDSIRGEVVVKGWRERTARQVVDRIRELAPLVGGFLLTQVEREGCLEGIDTDVVRRAVAAAGDVRVTAAGGIADPEEIAVLDRMGADAQVGLAIYSGSMLLGDGFAAPLQPSSPDGIWPTVVVDELGAALGLVWSNRESLRRAISERRGIYWSRSREQVWVKGETSGNTQELIRVDLDCDRDSLRFVVRQRGNGFCHSGSRSCWNQWFALGDLERVIAARAKTGDPQSGTVRLLSDPSLLQAKLQEEALELAAARGTRDTTAEVADLLYFALTAMLRGSSSLEAVFSELRRRNQRVTRRAMNAKQLSDDVS